MATILRLSNGIKVVLEEIPHVRSISLGIWVKNGSINETEKTNGISHFIEHMMFKGTEKRTAKDIAEEMDSVGGQINAYTTKEYTCYHTRVLDKHYHIALDVISDMFLNSKFDDQDIAKERNVIIEEINMYEDAPEEIVHELSQASAWKNSTISMPILGTEKNISTFNQKTLKDYKDEYYSPSRTVISITGNIKIEEVMKSLEEVFGGWKDKGYAPKEAKQIIYYPSVYTKQKDVEQLHTLITFPGIVRDDDRRYAYTVFNTIFGGGMSSILFQKVREEQGLTYSVYSYLSQYEHCGLFAIYAGMNPNQTEKVFNIIFNEIEKLKKNGIAEKVLKQTKEQIISNFIIGSESTVNRMTSNGGSALLRGKVRSQEETIENIEKITMDDIRDVIDNLFNLDKVALTAVGRLDNLDLENMLLNYKPTLVV